LKKFIFSVLIGGFVGVALGAAFLYIVPRLPTIFAQAFFYPAYDVISIFDRASILRPYAPAEDQYIIKTVDKSIPQEGKVVYADLADMRIVLFENGSQISEYPIKSIGREGTAWQTPLGIFEMSYKKENHFSSIGSVWMPYSMHFFGNYFIHGWPYYPDGMPVAEGYSGGCIRLATPDAGEIFEFVDSNTQLIVASTHAPIDTDVQFEYRRTDTPDIQSDYVVVDIDSGEVIASRASQEQQNIGSFAKLMNVLISLETLNQYQETIFDQNIVTIADVLYPVLMQADNEAATILFQHKNKGQYIEDMNTRAQSLGMINTSYADALGTNSQTVSTLDDVVKLFMYFYEYKPFMIKALNQNTYTKNSLNIKNNFDFENGTYRAGFVDQDNTLALGLIQKDFEKKTTNEEGVEQIETLSKNILIIVKDSIDAQKDLRDIRAWLDQSVSVIY